MSRTPLTWNDTPWTGVIGGITVDMLSALHDCGGVTDQTDDPMSGYALIYRVTGTETLMLLRWHVGASVQLPTDDLVHAKNAVLAMIRMEENDNE